MDTDLIEQSLQRVLATGEPVIELEVSCRAGGDPGGERFWSCIQFRIEGPDGKAAGVAHMMREVTERAQNQHRLALADEVSARGVIMGMVVLYRLGGSEPFTPADLSLARDLVARAAVPIDNARLYSRERAAALALQRGLLPRRIPEVPGLDLAYRYVPSEIDAEIGGDWFDVIPLGTGLTDSRYQTTRLHVPRGSTLILYTDGLIESPAADMSTGMARLARTLQTISKLPVIEACNTLLTALAPNPTDDIAILMART